MNHEFLLDHPSLSPTQPTHIVPHAPWKTLTYLGIPPQIGENSQMMMPLIAGVWIWQPGPLQPHTQPSHQFPVEAQTATAMQDSGMTIHVSGTSYCEILVCQMVRSLFLEGGTWYVRWWYILYIYPFLKKTPSHCKLGGCFYIYILKNIYIYTQIMKNIYTYIYLYKDIGCIDVIKSNMMKHQCCDPSILPELLNMSVAHFQCSVQHRCRPAIAHNKGACCLNARTVYCWVGIVFFLHMQKRSGLILQHWNLLTSKCLLGQLFPKDTLLKKCSKKKSQKSILQVLPSQIKGTHRPIGAGFIEVFGGFLHLYI